MACLIPTRQQAIAEHSSVMPVEERLLRSAVPSRSVADEIRFVAVDKG
jgi:hypothetical protein